MHSRTILIVDDYPPIVELLGLQLRFLGWNVVTAGNAAESLEAIRNVRPDLILLDMHLPEISGFELALLLKSTSAFREIPILATTGQSDPKELEECIAAGCCECIVKPFGTQELKERLERIWLGSCRAHPGVQSHAP